MNSQSIQALLQSGRYGEAEQRLREICMGTTADAESWFLLGVLRGMREDALGAEQALRKALAYQPDFPQARFNLAISLRDQGQFAEACVQLEEVVCMQPDHAGAFNALGCIHAQQDRGNDAERCFRAALSINPANHEALTNLGNVLAARGCVGQAVDLYRRALELAPNHAGAALNLGDALLAMGRVQDALAAFNHAVKLDRANPVAQVRLGTALNQVGQHDSAAAAFREALRLQPGHGEAQFYLAALGEGQSSTAPAEYVIKLFDGYAETFDAELVGKLQYCAPEMLFNAVNAALSGKKALDVLDLGCGTGLCGALFKPLSRMLAGVDLSPKMIARAQARGLYDSLETGDIVASLNARRHCLDVVLAADVFIYVGALPAVFEAAEMALRQDGLFAFTVESMEQDEADGYTLRRSGRYAHARSYLNGLASRFGFEEVAHEEFHLRLDDKKPIIGELYVLRKLRCEKVKDEPAEAAAVDGAEPRTPEATQETAQRHYAAFLAAIPPEVHRREEKLPTELRLMNAKPLVKLARIRKSVETLFAYSAEYIACRKGCAYCCHQAIDISLLEAEYIQQKTGIGYVPVTSSIQRDVRGFSEETPCPFLQQGACSIYEHRPLICRLAVNLDSDEYWCRFENWHKPGGVVPRPSFRSIYAAYTELNEKTGSIVADIRDFFPRGAR